MRTSAFDFELPEDLIALRPARPRDSARLLEVRYGEITHRHVRDLPGLLRPGDLCVFNDTRVIHAQLEGTRAPREGTDAAIRPRIGVTLHKRVGPDLWRAFAKPGRKLAPGDRIDFKEGLSAEVVAKDEGGDIGLKFDLAGSALDAAVEAAGEMPLPPYIAARRAVDSDDDRDYQTVFADRAGSVAAPTAGLHFTEDLLAALEAKGIGRARVTLHVGAGTFLPVKSDTLSGHKMHAEWGEVSAETAEKIAEAQARGGRIVAIGTTSLRILETAARAGKLQPFAGETDIFISPGFKFQIADLLWTNFHLPRSTLFMLVCAFAGTETMKRAYAEAIKARYRFYSYGDASLLYRASP